MGDSLAIRRLTVEDINSIVLLHKASWEEAFEDDQDYPTKSAASLWSDKVCSQKSIVFIAEFSSVPCGFVALDQDGEWIEITDLYVVPSHRQTGIAKKLLAKAFKEFGGENSRRFQLWVSDHNSPAIRLYSALGFIKGASEITKGQGGRQLVFHLYTRS